MKKETFLIDSERLYRFINANKQKFDKREHNNRYVVINMSMVRMQIPWIVSKLVYAKGIEYCTGDIPVVLTWDNNTELSDFFDSFGIRHYAINSLCKRNLFNAFVAMIKTLSFLILDGSGEGLKKMRYKKMVVGKNIYEDILRTSDLSTLKTCRNKVAIKKIFHLLWSVITLDKFLLKHNTEYAVIDDMAYHEGLFIKLFRNRGATIFACSNIVDKRVKFNEEGEAIRHTALDKEDISNFCNTSDQSVIDWVDDYLSERFKGNNGREIDRQAFRDKKVLSKEDFESILGIKFDKKTIVIMAHTFTDAVFNYGDYYFRDYYDWLENTLQIASTVKDVNWVLKPHPTRSSYNENVDSIEKLFEKYKTENMYILSDDISSESIKNIADILLTIGGNAGAEYACFGIPPIIVGKPYYSGQGYTIEPKTYDEYCKLLHNAKDILKLSDEQIQTAKKVFYYANSKKEDKLNYFNDKLAKIMNDDYFKMLEEISLEYFKSDDGTKEYNNKALDDLYEFIQENDYYETEYFKHGMGCIELE